MKTLTLLYLVAIVTANLIIAHFGPQATPYVAFVFIGFTLSSRDKLHDLWGEHVARNMLLLISVGGLLSYFLNSDSARIALASLVAFVVSELIDMVIYSRNKSRPFIARSNISNLFSSAVDSILFPVIAFGGFPWKIILLQFLAKVLGGFLWSVVLGKVRK